MRAQHLTRTALARRPGLQENAIRCLLDLDHRSHIDQLARALAALGTRLEVRCWLGMIVELYPKP
jgi:hypothetical protein